MKPITPNHPEQACESEDFRQRFSKQAAHSRRQKQSLENKNAAKKLFEILSNPFSNAPVSIDSRHLTPTAKCQPFIDIFRVKVRSMLPRHVTPALVSEILRRVSETPISVEEDPTSTSIAIRQVIIVENGSKITITGFFKRTVDSHLTAFPTLESFDVNVQP